MNNHPSKSHSAGGQQRTTAPLAILARTIAVMVVCEAAVMAFLYVANLVTIWNIVLDLILLSLLSTPLLYRFIVGPLEAALARSKQAEAQSRQDQQKLQESLTDLQRFNRMAVGRELRMIELKGQVNDLARQAGAIEPYDVLFANEPDTASDGPSAQSLERIAPGQSRRRIVATGSRSHRAPVKDQ